MENKKKVEYNFEINLGSKKIHIRKWKGRDKKAFLASLKAKEINESDVMDTLVYGCIREKVVLSTEEFKYVLSRIRAISLGEEIRIEFYCIECGEIHKETFQLNNIIRYTCGNLKEIKEKDVLIKLGEIRNKTIYIKKLGEDSLYDLLLRVESFNGDDAFTLDSLMEKFDDLDIDVLASIIEQYENAKFKVQDTNTVICPKCKNETDYIFDELPKFFPESWFEDE